MPLAIVHHDDSHRPVDGPAPVWRTCLCTVAFLEDAGALPIFDEVISGGGFPAAAFAGRADLLARMAPDGAVYQAGTLSANPVGMRAGLADALAAGARQAG